MAHIEYHPGEALFVRHIPLWKRAMDVTGAAGILLAGLPVFVVVALYIKAVSRGPVIFKQERIGIGGKTFTLWKFRTMHVGTDSRQHQEHVRSLIQACAENNNEPSMRKLDHAACLIPLGSLLRKTCIDEIPQLLNVLCGDMSMVGPRPALRYEVEAYLPWHSERLDTVPGMTGLWQVSGKNRLSFRQMVGLDIRYARERSFLLDMKILFETLPAILTQVRESLERKENS